MTRIGSSWGPLSVEPWRRVVANLVSIACVMSLFGVLAPGLTGCAVVPGQGSANDPEPTALESSAAIIPATATASSIQSSQYPASFAADNNLSTRWSSAFSDPQWIQLDLGSVQPIGEVRLYWQHSYAVAYQIQVSNDAASWTTIENVTNGTGGTTDFTGLTASARYVRMYGTKRFTVYGYSLWEFQVLPPAAPGTDAGGGAASDGASGASDAAADIAAADAAPGDVAADAATGADGGSPNDGAGADAGSSSEGGGPATQLTGAVATASSIQSSTLAAAFGGDNNFSTRWSSAFSDPQWLQLDFGSTKSISEVKLYWENAYAKAYQIQVSNDGSTWTTVRSITAGTGGTDDLTGLGASGRYVRMYGTQRATPYGYSLWEFQAFTGGSSVADAGGSSDGSTDAQADSSGSGGSTDAADAGFANCKRGMAYGYDSVADLTALSQGISWWYNWALVPDQGVGSAYTNLGVEFVPMQWGGSFSASTDESKIPSTAGWLLGFNEPEAANQANLTPQQAASLWPQMEQIAKDRNLKLVSPAVNYCGGNCNETSPFTWLDQFFAACTNCQVDAIAVHWYSCYNGSAQDKTNGLQNYVNNMTKYNKPIWLTEFSALGSGCATDATTESQYMAAALPWLENNAHVQRYAWFTGRSTGTPGISLLGASGQLTALGQQYVSAPQSCGK